MPEGPSIVLVKEAIRNLVGKRIVGARGSSKAIDFGRLLGTKIISIKTWGKHLLICFKGFTLRIHFLMFGSYTVDVAKPNRIPKLHIQFSGKRALFIYAAAIATIEEPLNKVYDWSADVMNKKWDSKNALLKMNQRSFMLISDVLLDQQIFSGVGNIIKNEVLFRVKVHPKSLLGKIPTSKKKAIIEEAVHYSAQFLEWKRAFTLKKHWQAYTKKKCPRDANMFTKEYVGNTKRRTFFCAVCQRLYS